MWNVIIKVINDNRLESSPLSLCSGFDIYSYCRNLWPTFGCNICAKPVRINRMLSRARCPQHSVVAAGVIHHGNTTVWDIVPHRTTDRTFDCWCIWSSKDFASPFIMLPWLQNPAWRNASAFDLICAAKVLVILQKRHSVKLLNGNVPARCWQLLLLCTVCNCLVNGCLHCHCHLTTIQKVRKPVRADTMPPHGVLNGGKP